MNFRFKNIFPLPYVGEKYYHFIFLILGNLRLLILVLGIRNWI
jgi:hypothetical protein